MLHDHRPDGRPAAARRLLAASRRDLVVAACVVGWIGAVLLLDAVDVPGTPRPGEDGTLWSSGPEVARQVLLGVTTWLVLGALLRRESPLVRTQTLVVVGLATCVEYTFSPLLEAYVYRIGTVPFFVPPGHGLVYLAALALGRSALFAALRRPLVAGTVVVGGAWAGHGLVAARPDVLGAFWFCCLLGFLAWGRSRLLYVGAFVVVSYLELVGTALGTWAWAPSDPVLGVVSQGNPPSGAAGGYGWFDLYALLLAPWVLRQTRRAQSLAARVASTWSWSRPFVATALPPKGPSAPSTEVNRPPASTTTGTSAAMSYRCSDGSQATSTAPSASSMYDQKSP